MCARPDLAAGARDCDGSSTARPTVAGVGQGIADVPQRLVHLGGPRRQGNRMGDRAAAGALRAVATGHRAARSRHDRVRCDGHGRRVRSRPAGQGRISAVRGRRRRRRKQLVAPTGHRRGLGGDGAHRVAADVGGQGSGHLAGRASSAGRWAATAPCCSAVRSGPARTAAICAVAPALFTDYAEASSRAHSTGRRTGSPTRSTEHGRSPRSRCASTAAPATATTWPPNSSSHRCADRQSGVSFAGGHDVAAWREKLPRQLAWLAS